MKTQLKLFNFETKKQKEKRLKEKKEKRDFDKILKEGKKFFRISGHVRNRATPDSFTNLTNVSHLPRDPPLTPP
ncbi:unnamed protein product [marine sediment metagenome]|uniref:Uncharacterized protein n=1 Tax=marine sediment metagenome TaxID=412755 RepID=X1LQB1_9ZZZZ